MFLKTNIPGYMKDEKTGSVMNTNHNELQQVLSARHKIIELQLLNTKVNRMENDIDEIKAMLVRLLEKEGK